MSWPCFSLGKEMLIVQIDFVSFLEHLSIAFFDLKLKKRHILTLLLRLKCYLGTNFQQSISQISSRHLLLNRSYNSTLLSHCDQGHWPSTFTVALCFQSSATVQSEPLKKKMLDINKKFLSAWGMIVYWLWIMERIYCVLQWQLNTSIFLLIESWCVASRKAIGSAFMG